MPRPQPVHRERRSARFARRPSKWWPARRRPGSRPKPSSTGSAAKSNTGSTARSKAPARHSTTDSATAKNSPRCLSPCAARRISPPACVWVPGHCYPEFYLEDEQGQGHWYPCQAAGTRIFGAMPEARPDPAERRQLPRRRQPTTRALRAGDPDRQECHRGSGSAVRAEAAGVAAVVGCRMRDNEPPTSTPTSYRSRRRFDAGGDLLSLGIPVLPGRLVVARS